MIVLYWYFNITWSKIKIYFCYSKYFCFYLNCTTLCNFNQFNYSIASATKDKLNTANTYDWISAWKQVNKMLANAGNTGVSGARTWLMRDIIKKPLKMLPNIRNVIDTGTAMSVSNGIRILYLPRYFAFGDISFQVIYPVGVRIRCLLCWFWMLTSLYVDTHSSSVICFFP